MAKELPKRHPQTIAIDDWMKTKEFQFASDPSTLDPLHEARQYLQNRLKKAFQAGWDEAMKARKADD